MILSSFTLGIAGFKPDERTPSSAPPIPSSQSDEPLWKTRVIVVGGGLSGLITAYALEKHGIATQVLEASDVWGGRMYTTYYSDGLHAEAGTQEIWQTNELLNIMKELKVPIEDRVEKAYSSMLMDGKIYPLDKSTDAYFLSFLSREEYETLKHWRERARLLHDVAEKEGIKNEEIKKLQDVSFARWIDDEKLPPKVGEWIRLTLECELGDDWTRFSALFGLLEFDTFLGDSGEPNYLIKNGNIHVAIAIANALPHKTLNVTVTRIERGETFDHKSWARVSYLKDHQMKTIEGEAVVVATPFWRLHQIVMDPPLSDEKLQAISTLGGGQYTVVHFLISKDAHKLWRVNGKTPFPVLTRGPLGVVYGVINESPATQSLDVFSLLTYGDFAHSFHMVQRDQKIKELLVELETLWSGFSNYVRASYVYGYHPWGVPLWPPGRSPLDVQADAVRRPDGNLYLVGDYLWNAHSDGAVRGAEEAAQRLVSELCGGRRKCE
jgi:monoamine oxidase